LGTSAGPTPANARELRNTLYRAAALSDAAVLEPDDFADQLADAEQSRRTISLENMSDRQISELLAHHKNNISAVARELKVPRTSLRDRVRRIGRVA